MSSLNKLDASITDAITKAELQKVSVNLEVSVRALKDAKAGLEDIDHTNIKAIREYWQEIIGALGLEVEMLKELLKYY